MNQPAEDRCPECDRRRSLRQRQRDSERDDLLRAWINILTGWRNQAYARGAPIEETAHLTYDLAALRAGWPSGSIIIEIHTRGLMEDVV